MKKSVFNLSTALGFLFCSLPVFAMDPPPEESEVTSLTQLMSKQLYDSALSDANLGILTTVANLRNPEVVREDIQELVFDQFCYKPPNPTQPNYLLISFLSNVSLNDCCLGPILLNNPTFFTPLDESKFLKFLNVSDI